MVGDAKGKMAARRVPAAVMTSTSYSAEQGPVNAHIAAAVDRDLEPRAVAFLSGGGALERGDVPNRMGSRRHAR